MPDGSRERLFQHKMRGMLQQISLGLELIESRLTVKDYAAAEPILDLMQDSTRQLHDCLHGAISAAVAAPEPANTERNILLLEDVAAECDLLSAFLRDSGWNPFVFSRCDLAMQWLTSSGTSVSIALVDMQLDGCNGADFIRDLRSRSEFDAIPAFGVTGTLPEEVGLQIGFDLVDEWFRKPVNPRGLLNKIEEYCTGPQLLCGVS